MPKFWNIMRNEQINQSEIRIDGDIVMEQDFWDWLFDKPDNSATGLLKELKNLDGEDITVWINSNGGECFAASVLYTALKSHKGKVTVKVDGTAISAASVIAMAGDEILMAPTAVMMIHNPLTVAQGEVKDMEKAIRVLSEVKETIINAYAKKTCKPRDEISQLMDDETWMGANKAIEMGFADGVLFEDDSAAITNEYLSGAKAIYNSLKINRVDTEGLLNALQVRTNNQDIVNVALNELALEKQRFGGI